MQIDAELVGVAERTNPFDAVAEPPSLPSASSDGVIVGRSIVILKNLSGESGMGEKISVALALL